MARYRARGREQMVERYQQRRQEIIDQTAALQSNVEVSPQEQSLQNVQHTRSMPPMPMPIHVTEKQRKINRANTELEYALNKQIEQRRKAKAEEEQLLKDLGGKVPGYSGKDDEA